MHPQRVLDRKKQRASADVQRAKDITAAKEQNVQQFAEDAAKYHKEAEQRREVHIMYSIECGL